MKPTLFHQIELKFISLVFLLLWQPISHAQTAYVRVNISTDNMPSSTQRVQALCSLNDTTSTIESSASAVINNGRFIGSIDVPFDLTKPIDQYGNVQCQLRLCSSATVCETPIKGSSVAIPDKTFNAYNENAFHRLDGVENIEIATAPYPPSPIIIPNLGNTNPSVIPNISPSRTASFSGPVGVASNRVGTLINPVTIKNTGVTKSGTLDATDIEESFTYRGPAITPTSTGSSNTTPTVNSVPQLTDLKVISAASNAFLFYDDPRASLPQSPEYVEYFYFDDTVTLQVSIDSPAPENGLTVQISTSSLRPAFPNTSVLIPEGETHAEVAIQTETPQGYAYSNNFSAHSFYQVNVQASLDNQQTSTFFKITHLSAFSEPDPEIKINRIIFPPKATNSSAEEQLFRLILNDRAPEDGALIALFNSRTDIVHMPSFVTVPEGQRAVDVQLTTSPVSTQQNVTMTASYNDIPKTTQIHVNPAQLKGISLDPSRIIAGDSATGTVRINSPAPTGGTTVTLVNHDPNNGSLPTNVVIPAGKISVTFPITTISSTEVGFSNTSHAIQIEAQLADHNANAILQVSLQPEVTAMTLDPRKIEPGGNVSAEIRLSGNAPSEGSEVLLSSSTPLVTIPTSIRIPAGERSATFNLATQTVTEFVPFTMQTTNHGNNKNFNFNLSPLLSAIHFSTAASSPLIGFSHNMEGGHSIETSIILRRARSTDTTVQLTSNSTKVTLPSTVTIPAGTTRFNFTLSTESVTAPTAIDVSATFEGVTTSDSLTLISVEAATPATLTDILWSSEQLIGPRNRTYTGTVKLNKNALSNTRVYLEHNGGENIVIPSNFLIREGEAEGSFEVTAIATESNQLITVSARLIDTTHIEKNLAILPESWRLKELILPPSPIISASNSITQVRAVVSITQALKRDHTINIDLVSSRPNIISIPSSIVLQDSEADFYLDINPVNALESVTITATADGISKSETLLISPHESLLILDNLDIPTNKPLIANTQHLGSVSMNHALRHDGREIIILSSSHPEIISIPSNILITGNTSSSSFNFTTANVSEVKTVTITASHNGITLTKIVDVTPN